MSGLHIPAAPGAEGWTKLKDSRQWKTYVQSEIDEMASAASADRISCHGNAGNGVPFHDATMVVREAGHLSRPVAYTHQCRSNCRWFNPETRQMEGRAHCTCDSCF